MSEWKTVTLNEVCEIQRGGSPRPIEQYITEAENGINWIKIGDVAEGAKYITSTKEKIKPDGAQRSRVVECGDFLLTNSMSFGRPYILRTNGCIHDGWLVLRYHKDKLTEDYLYHVLSSDFVYAQFVKYASGAVVKNLNTDVVKRVEIPLPPLLEQRRISAILDKADALRTKRREALAQLDCLTQSIFIEMFGDPGSEKGRFNMLPLSSLVNDGFQNGAYFPKEKYTRDGVEMVHMSDAFGGVIERGGLKRVDCDQKDVDKYSLTSDDLVIARRSLTYEGAAKPCMVPEAGEALIFESSFIRVRPRKSLITPLYLFHYLNNKRVRDKFVRPYVTQSTISGINQSNLAKIPIAVPPIELQVEFSAVIRQVEMIKNRFLEASKYDDGLFSSLQRSAFRGEV